MRGQEQFYGDLRHRQVGGEQGQQAQLGGGQRRRTGDAWTAIVRNPGSQRGGLADQGAEAGPPLEHFVDLPHEGPCPRQVVQPEVGISKPDPGLNGQLGHRVGQQVP